MNNVTDFESSDDDVSSRALLQDVHVDGERCVYDGSWVTQAWVVGLRPSGTGKPMVLAALASTVYNNPECL